VNDPGSQRLVARTPPTGDPRARGGAVHDAVLDLAALVEEELDLVAAGRIAVLPELHERRALALAALPEQLSAPEREALVRVHQLQEQVTSLLQLAVTETAAQLGRLQRGSTALKGYANALKSA
jgi:hypothetical protein